MSAADSYVYCRHLRVPRSRQMTAVLPPLVPQLPFPGSLFADAVDATKRPSKLVHAVRSTHIFIPHYFIHVYYLCILAHHISRGILQPVMASINALLMVVDRGHVSSSLRV
jgi:hypothetical protein